MELKVNLNQAKESMPSWKWSGFQILMAEAEMSTSKELESSYQAMEVRVYKVKLSWHPGICQSNKRFSCTQWVALDGSLKYKTNFVKVSRAFKNRV